MRPTTTRTVICKVDMAVVVSQEEFGRIKRIIPLSSFCNIYVFSLITFTICPYVVTSNLRLFRALNLLTMSRGRAMSRRKPF